MTGVRPAESAQMLSVDDVARLLAVSKMTVYRLINRYELPAYRFGRVYRVRVDDFEAYVAAAVTGPEAS